MIKYKSTRLELFPDKEQTAEMVKMAGATRFLWNYVLGLQKEQYDQTGKIIPFADIEDLLPSIIEKYDFLQTYDQRSLIDVVRNLEISIDKKIKKENCLPWFKKKSHHRDWFIVYPPFRLEDDAIDFGAGLIKYQKCDTKFTDISCDFISVKRKEDEWTCALVKRIIKND